MPTTRRRALAGALALPCVACANLRPAKPSDRTSDRTTEWFAAIRRGDLAAIAGGIAVQPSLLDARDADGASALTIALLAEQTAAADLLTARGYTPDLVESAYLGDWDRFDALARADPAEVTASHPLGGPALTAAARGGVGDDVWRVYAHGAVPDPEDRDPSAPSPARAAMEHRDLARAEVTTAALLANGADPNAAQPGGASILHAAAARGSSALVELLIRKHARTDARDSKGRTPLDVAERAGHSAVVELLRNHAAIPRDHLALRRAFDAHGQPYRPVSITGITLAEQRTFVGKGHTDLAAIERGLARHPTLVHACGASTEMAVEAAGHVGQAAIVEVLLDHGAPCSMPAALVRAHARGRTENVGALLGRDPDRIHERGPHDFPLLWYPVMLGGSLALTELLVAHGARVEMQHHMGSTALHLAAAYGQIDLVALLLEHGGDPHRVARQSDGQLQTPARLAQVEGHAAIVRMLEDHGRSHR